MTESKSKKDVGKSWTSACNWLTEKQSRLEEQQKVMEEKFLLKREDGTIRLANIVKYLENISDR